MISTRCERSREAISLRLDGMLSSFESALLDRHVRNCPSCHAFAVSANELTGLLRDAVLEEPARQVLIPSAPARTIRRSAAAALSACLVAAAAAVVLIWPTAPQNQVGKSSLVGGAVMVVFAAEPSVGNANVEVPRLRMQPASIADGPVHGYFSAQV